MHIRYTYAPTQPRPGKVIAGAALDVFAVEPLPKESELWDCDNMLMVGAVLMVVVQMVGVVMQCGDGGRGDDGECDGT